MSLIRKFMMVAVLLAFVVPVLSAKDKEGSTVVTLSPFETAPTIDGKIDEGEWAEATRSSAFFSLRGRTLEPRHTVAWAGYTEDALYIAVESAVRPTGLKAEERDMGRLISDSGIELRIDPDRDHRSGDREDLEEEDGLNYFQMIGNSVGAMRDVKFAAGASDVGWDFGGEFENHVDEEEGLWQAEFRIPWSSLGWEDGAKAGRSIGLIIARNYKNPGGQPSWEPAYKSAFDSLGQYAEVRLDPGEPVARLLQFDHETFQGEAPLELEVLNPGDEPREVNVDMLITSKTMPEIEDETVLEIEPGESEVFTHEISSGRLHDTDQHKLEKLEVTDADTGETFFRWEGAVYSEPREKLWNVVDEPNPDAAAKVGYYPSYELMKVWLDVHELGEDYEDIRTAHIRVEDPDGNEVMEDSHTWSEDSTSSMVKYDVPDLDEGVYDVTIEFEGYEDQMLRHFERREFEWEDNQLGITDEIYPPFEPIDVDGDTIDVVMREYDLGGLGLWNAVRARGNNRMWVEENGEGERTDIYDTRYEPDPDEKGAHLEYRDLLAEPMTVRVSQDGSGLDAEGEALEATGEITSREPQEVAFEGSASHPGVDVETRTITEFDGTTRVEMDLLPGDEEEEIDALWVDIPLRDELMPLYHVSTTALRVNPAGETPDGEGLVWDTRDFPDGRWPTGFRPYLWLGGAERGLSWFADNDKDWVKDVDLEEGEYAPALSLHREDGVLTLRVHLVQKPITLERERNIVFGLMATPAKPMPERWRAFGRPDHPGVSFKMGHGFGLYGSYASKYPVNYDWARFDHSYAKRTGDEELREDSAERVEDWYERNIDERAQRVQKLDRLDGLDFSGYDPDGFFSVYYDEFHSTLVKGGEEAPAFYTEWTGDPLSESYFSDPPPVRISMGTGPLVQSYRDFACWYAREWLERGFGIYFDNSFPKRAYDPVTTNAYEWNGEIIPSAGIWNHRRYLRRIWNMHQEMRDPEAPQAMMIHMTNTHIAPYMVWNEVNLDLEWRRDDDKKLQQIWAPDLLRAQTLGLQTGNIPSVMGFSMGPAMLVHEVRAGGGVGIGGGSLPDSWVEFGYAEPGTRVYNYWDPDPPLQVSDEDCKWLLMQRDGRLLIYLVTWNSDSSEVTLNLDLDQLDVDVSAVIDAEEDEQIGTLEDGQFTVPMERYGVRTLVVE